MAKENPATDEYQAESSSKQGHAVCGLCDVSAFIGLVFQSEDTT
jgi:hypothetical protein